jgi:hypothetical protein
MIKEIEVDGVRHSIQAENTIKTTWAELKALRDEAKLNAGTFYRITDYVTTTTQEETKSANHPFDVIVLALSENTLCEDAKAILHEGDTYFAYSDLSAWELKYCLDNDKTRFAWADETNGKGVIYRMVDEKSNDCPYDFKNILFYNTKFTSSTTSDKYYYTFSFVVSDVLYDGTTEKRAKHCYGNMMGGCYQSGALRLNKNVFRNSSFSYFLNFNILRENCSSNTFGDYCYSNTFGNDCSYNTFGNYCSFNTLESRVQNRSLDSDTTTLTLRINEEFYDDGSGQLVPIKHPDLSTQPSILPYKFMGQYVYEQLIPNIKGIGVNIPLSSFAVHNPLIIEATSICNVMQIKDSSDTKPFFHSDGDYFYIQTSGISESENVEYFRIVYTSMPEEGDYYGYNN